MNVTSIITILVETAKLLEANGIQYALAGGIAANQYRTTMRETGDVDFALFSSEPVEDKAKEIIESFGFTASLLTQPQLEGGPRFALKNKSLPKQVILGRYKDYPELIGLDFLLPAIPWVKEAVERAQLNQIPLIPDKSFPTLTIEDVIITKLLAYNARMTRSKDYNDLLEILGTKPNLDIDYLVNKIKQYTLTIPQSLHVHCDYRLLRASRRS